MDEKQIRVGNLFNKIDTMSNEPLGVAEFTAHTWYRIGECIDFLEWYTPIPLIEEWLLKFGFSGKGRFTDYNLKSDKYQFHFGNNSLAVIDFDLMQGLAFKIQYVHQLQNLYFAFTREELTIK